MKEINILLQHKVINILRQYFLDQPAAFLLSFTLAEAICWVSKHDYEIAFFSFFSFFMGQSLSEDGIHGSSILILVDGVVLRTFVSVSAVAPALLSGFCMSK